MALLVELGLKFSYVEDLNFHQHPMVSTFEHSFLSLVQVSKIFHLNLKLQHGFNKSLETCGFF
jgi:hypothetical protein